MVENKQVNEDGVPVTTTNNAGSGLVEPQAPIAKGSVFRRFKEMKKSTKSDNNK